MIYQPIIHGRDQSSWKFISFSSDNFQTVTIPVDLEHKEFFLFFSITPNETLDFEPTAVNFFRYREYNTDVNIYCSYMDRDSNSIATKNIEAAELYSFSYDSANDKTQIDSLTNIGFYVPGPWGMWYCFYRDADL